MDQDAFKNMSLGDTISKPLTKTTTAKLTWKHVLVVHKRRERITGARTKNAPDERLGRVVGALSVRMDGLAIREQVVDGGGPKCVVLLQQDIEVVNISRVSLLCNLDVKVTISYTSWVSDKIDMPVGRTRRTRGCPES